MTLPRPCSAAEAIQRAVSVVGRPDPYVLGCGDYVPASPGALPFTTNAHGTGCDCWGLAGSWCWKLPRHRPGYNHGAWATVADDVNCDSAIEQSEHRHELADILWESVDYPALGDLLVFPSIRGPDGRRIRIGHVGLVVGLCAEWDPAMPQYGLLEVVQCQAGTQPAIKRGPGMAWMHRELFKGAVDHAWRTRILRAVP